MSIFSNWSYTATLTFWKPTLNEWSEPSSWERISLSGTFHAGGKQGVDNMGEEFQPLLTVYFEADPSTAPEPGWKMMTGDVSDLEPPAEAHTVRTAVQFDPSTFNEGLPDFRVQTT